MSELIVIGYNDKDTATAAYEKVISLQADFIVELRGLAIVTVDEDGKTHVDTPQRIVGASAASGAIWGLLLGLLFFVPGMAILGGAMGALIGKLNKTQVSNAFRAQVDEMLKPGGSAVVIMASKVTEDKFAAALAPYNGRVLKSSLSDADEKELADTLAE